jgi:hypothetical protein
MSSSRGLSAEVEAELIARSIVTHREVALSRNPRVNQFDEGGNCMARILVEDVVRVTVSGPEADVQIISCDGTVIRDTNAERVAREEELVSRLAPKIAISALIRDLASTYRRAISDPTNEFVHLYEIRDRLSTDYGSDEKARNALGISAAELKRIGKLANAKPTTVWSPSRRVRHVERADCGGVG